MILKILKAYSTPNQIVGEDESFKEIILEADNFILKPIEGTNTVKSGDKPNKMRWFLEHKSGNYTFQEAYLMNNEGKTIHKYG